MALRCPYLRLWFHLETCTVERLAASAKSLFVLPAADRWDSQWEWSYALANSACVPGIGSEEVGVEEQFLAWWTAQIQRRWAHEELGSWGRCSPEPAASKQPVHSGGCPMSQQMYPRLPPALPNQLQLSQLSSSAGVTGKVSSAWYIVCRVLLVWSHGLCFVKWREVNFNFFYKAMKSSFSGKNTAILPAVGCSLVQYSSNLFGLGQYHCRMGTIHGSRWNLPLPWKVVFHLSCSSLGDPAMHPQQCPHRGQKAGEGWASCCSSGPVCWCNPMCRDSSFLG